MNFRYSSSEDTCASPFADDQTIGAVCRAHAIAETTFYRWRKQFGAMTVSEVQRLRELENENSRLKRLLAERDLALDALKELLA